MSTGGPRGITALATLLGQLASGMPVRAAEFAGSRGYARSSVFDLTRRLQKEGLLVRDDDGMLLAGPMAYELAWSACGLAGLRGPAEAVLLWLCDNVQGEASLLAGCDELLAVAGPVPGSAGQMIELCLPIRDKRGEERMRLILRLGAQADRGLAEAAMRRAAATLEDHLEMLP